MATKGLLDLAGITAQIQSRLDAREGPARVDLRTLDALATEVQGVLIAAMTQGNGTVAETIVNQIAALREELAGPSPSPLEALLVERVVACWLHLQHTELRYAQHLGRLTMAQGEYHQRSIERAERRYLAAIKALATLRRLLTPVMQVNIAEKQINFVPE